MGLIKDIKDIEEPNKIEIKFKLGDNVHFVPEGTDITKAGKIIRIRADIWSDDESEKQYITYTIEYDNGKRVDVSHRKVFA